MDEQENAKYEAQDWEVVPVRSIKTRKSGQDESPALTDPIRVIGESIRQIFPPEARMHFHTARREMLLAVRSLVDAALERVDKDVETERASISEKEGVSDT